MANIDLVIQIKLNQLVSENVHVSTDLPTKRIYRCHSDKHFSEFLPTTYRRKSTGIDKEQNYVNVTLCRPIKETVIFSKSRCLRPTKQIRPRHVAYDIGKSFRVAAAAANATSRSIL